MENYWIAGSVLHKSRMLQLVCVCVCVFFFFLGGGGGGVCFFYFIFKGEKKEIVL